MPNKPRPEISMETKHTPGPWFAVEAESMKYCSVVEFEYGSGARGTVGLIGTDGVTVGASDLERQNADARLIAAAPDMLAFIAKIADFDPTFAKGHYKQQIADARELVAKATGAA
ncbi:hypothetical protein AI27_06535 [Sphingomonas sp. BHC-A]|nr:hypothetical protein AI27_06535 [Sphingomonas sp. BHC-A]